MSSSAHWQTQQTAKWSPTKPIYPGLGLPLRLYNRREQQCPIGAHASCPGAFTDPLPVREVAVLSIMESLTDKVDWHIKVHDEEIVSKWRTEAMAVPNKHWWELATSAKRQSWEADGRVNLNSDHNEAYIKIPKNIMTGDAFDFCIYELRNKAKYFQRTGIVPTLDACASVAKSDTLVPNSLHESLLAAYRTLMDDQAECPDWHPNSGDKVQDLVHPSMYPLVYHWTRGFQDEVVGIEDAISQWSGRGNVIEGLDERERTDHERPSYGLGVAELPPDFWSVHYQWLPSNCAFQDDGSVRFTSYINNLHPVRYPDIYRALEKLVEASLPMWDQCLKVASDYRTVTGPGRSGGRFGIPESPDDDEPSNWDPSDPEDCADAEVDPETLEDNGWEEDYMDDGSESARELLTEAKWKAVRNPILADPVFEDIDYEPKSDNRLFVKFRESGLQIIVKMASIELTPEKPQFPQGSWHVEGQMNEHIAATALYYLDSENITSSNLSFRMQTSAHLNDDDKFNVGQDNYHWMDSIYGTSFGAGSGGTCLQNYGSVETREKRLLVFPNVFQHRVSPFELADPTKPGHRRFIALWLVDPHKRIISTANVPPQQRSWWLESILGTRTKGDSKSGPTTDLPPEIVSWIQETGVQTPQSTREATLPEEVMAMIRGDAPDDGLPMSSKEAKEHRLNLMQERSGHVVQSVLKWQRHAYNFCEH